MSEPSLTMQLIYDILSEHGFYLEPGLYLDKPDKEVVIVRSNIALRADHVQLVISSDGLVTIDTLVAFETNGDVRLTTRTFSYRDGGMIDSQHLYSSSLQSPEFSIDDVVRIIRETLTGIAIDASRK